MIEINLLPHREAKRAADLRQTVAVLALGLLVVGVVIVIVEGTLKASQSSAEESIRKLEAEIAIYKPEEQRVEGFKKKKSELEDKIDVIRGLDRARSGPVRIFDELSRNTPDRLWLTSISTAGVAITVEGNSLDTGVVADFLRSLNGSDYFKDVDLERTLPGPEVEGVRLVHFIITAALAQSSLEDEDGADGDA
jgi:type IV pilus assembly protein PilN